MNRRCGGAFHDERRGPPTLTSLAGRVRPPLWPADHLLKPWLCRRLFTAAAPTAVVVSVPTDGDAANVAAAAAMNLFLHPHAPPPPPCWSAPSPPLRRPLRSRPAGRLPWPRRPRRQPHTAVGAFAALCASALPVAVGRPSLANVSGTDPAGAAPLTSAPLAATLRAAAMMAPAAAAAAAAVLHVLQPWRQPSSFPSRPPARPPARPPTCPASPTSAFNVPPAPVSIPPPPFLVVVP